MVIYVFCLLAGIQEWCENQSLYSMCYIIHILRLDEMVSRTFLEIDWDNYPLVMLNRILGSGIRLIFESFAYLIDLSLEDLCRFNRVNYTIIIRYNWALV